MTTTLPSIATNTARSCKTVITSTDGWRTVSYQPYAFRARRPQRSFRRLLPNSAARVLPSGLVTTTFYLTGLFFCLIAVDLTGKIYRTDAALEKENLMFCYECNTMVNGKSCSNFTDKDEYSRFSTKCTGDRKTCMVNDAAITFYYAPVTRGRRRMMAEIRFAGRFQINWLNKTIYLISFFLAPRIRRTRRGQNPRLGARFIPCTERDGARARAR